MLGTLFATICHYLRLLATIRTIRDYSHYSYYSLFAIQDYSLFAICDYLLFAICYSGFPDTLVVVVIVIDGNQKYNKEDICLQTLFLLFKCSKP